MNRPIDASDHSAQQGYHSHISTLLGALAAGEAGKAMRRDGQSFLLCQGSRIIRLNIDGAYVRATVAIARAEEPGVPLMRYLLESNFPYTFARFTLDGSLIRLQFDADISVYGPERIEKGLRELAEAAEMQHHTLLTQYEALTDTDTAAFHPAASQVCEAQYKYFGAWIAEAIEATTTLDPVRHREGISDILLTALLRIDALIRPEGELRFTIRQLLDDFISQKHSTSWEAQNTGLRKNLEDLKAWTPEAFTSCCGHYPRAFLPGEQFDPKKPGNLLQYTNSYLLPTGKRIR